MQFSSSVHSRWIWDTHYSYETQAHNSIFSWISEKESIILFYILSSLSFESFFKSVIRTFSFRLITVPRHPLQFLPIICFVLEAWKLQCAFQFNVCVSVSVILSVQSTHFPIQKSLSISDLLVLEDRSCPCVLCMFWYVPRVPCSGCSIGSVSVIDTSFSIIMLRAFIWNLYSVWF